MHTSTQAHTRARAHTSAATCRTRLELVHLLVVKHKALQLKAQVRRQRAQYHLSRCVDLKGAVGGGQQRSAIRERGGAHTLWCPAEVSMKKKGAPTLSGAQQRSAFREKGHQHFLGPSRGQRLERKGTNTFWGPVEVSV
eukprot:353621-Chlamydomonas_euryale.AAC.2